MAGPVYEMRIYQFNIRGHIEFLQTTENEKFWAKRQSFSHVLGMWRTELNGLFQYIHIAQYDSLDHLFKVRETMAGDDEWNASLVHMVDMQWDFQNALLTTLPGTALNTDFQPSEAAVYELQIVPENSRTPSFGAGATLVGHFSTVYGKSKTDYLLIRYPDKRSALMDALRNRKDLPDGAETRLMVPLSVSGLH